MTSLVKRLGREEVDNLGSHTLRNALNELKGGNAIVFNRGAVDFLDLVSSKNFHCR